MSPTYLGIDVGTTNVKALLCDSAGRTVARASRPHPTSHRTATEAEQNPDGWWTATRAAVAEIAASAGLGDLAGIAFSAQAPTLIALNAAGEVLRPAMIWMDRRAGVQCDALVGELGADQYMHRAGNRADPFYVAPKIMWLRENEPAVLARAASFVQIPGYMAFRATGSMSLDVAHASILGFGNPQNWDAELLARAGIDATKLPPVVASTAVVGHTTGEALPGVAAGIPVAAGTVDSAAAAMEVDLAEHEALLMTGTSSVLVMPRPQRLASAQFISMAAAEDGWYDLAAVVSSGSSIEWLRSVTGGELSDLLERAATAPAGAHGLIFLPYLAGERSPWWDTDARGGFVGLTATHTMADLARAVLEGTAFALRQNLVAAGQLGHDIRTLVANGGPARSALWNQIIADVTGLPLEYHESSGGSPFGCCRLAARMVGKDLPITDRTAIRVEPNPVNHGVYDDLFVAYDQLYPALREVARRLAHHSGG